MLVRGIVCALLLTSCGTAPRVVTAPNPSPLARPADLRGAPTPSSVGRPVRTDCRVVKCVAVTFDGGPGRYTAELLDLLRQRRAPVTFFLIGRKVPIRPELVRRMAAEGHELANHSWSHPRLSDVTPKRVTAELRRTNAAITALTGVTPTLMRPPQGATSLTVGQISRDLGLAQTLWDVKALDWRDHNTRLIERRILSGARRDSIILLHDIYSGTVPAVPKIVDTLRERGLTLVTVTDLLRRPVPGRIYFDGRGGTVLG